MKTIVVLILCVALPLALMASEGGFKISYDGGSVANVKTGATLRLSLDGNTIRFLNGKTEVLSIPASAVTEISYGQDVHRRVGTAVAVGVFTLGVGALTALSKSKKHFVGLTWADGDKKGGLAVQCSKNDYRGVLAGLEGVTGKKAVDSESMTVKN
jgi:CxxC motif-containing protein (DUF1111 family)